MSDKTSSSGLKGFFSAVSFLTVIPVSGRLTGNDENLQGAPVWFPVVGLLAGLVVCLSDTYLLSFLPPLLRASLCMLFFISVSNGLHLDGLADTADGFLSSRPRDRILEIMRDSRIGTMGAAAVSAMMIIKTCAIYSLDENARSAALIMAPIAGRCSITACLAFFDYARNEGGLASVFTRNIQWKHGVLSFAALAASGFILYGLHGFTVALSVSGFIMLWAYYSKGKIGGFTGDTLGAGCELTELTVLVLFAAKI